MGDTRDRAARQRSKRYARMFSALFFGLVFFVTGAMGLRLRAGDNRWTGRPIPSQVAVGLGMIALGVYWSRRLDDPRLRVHVRKPPIKHVGGGRSAGAARRRPDELQP